jgi:hypothetical protein
MEENANEQEKIKEVSAWAMFVPEAVYDLIGRIFPGIVVITAFASASHAPLGLGLPSWLIGVLAIIAGFLFGLLGDVIGDATSSRVLAWLYGAKYSFWRYFDSVDGAKQKVLLKMWAERNCLWNLFLGWLCIWLLRLPLARNLSLVMRLSIAVVLLALHLRWDWTCRARARTWAEEWRQSYGSFKVRGERGL